MWLRCGEGPLALAKRVLTSLAREKSLTDVEEHPLRFLCPLVCFVHVPF